MHERVSCRAKRRDNDSLRSHFLKVTRLYLLEVGTTIHRHYNVSLEKSTTYHVTQHNKQSSC